MTWFGIVPWLERRRVMRDLKTAERLENEMLAIDDGNLVNRAKVAVEAGDRTAALRFWQEALARYPTFARTSKDALEILISLGQFNEAETLMLERRKRQPRNPSWAEGYAMVAQRRGDLELAIERWAQVRKKFPGADSAYVHGVNCLRNVGRLEDAEALQAAASRRFPLNPFLWIAGARIAEDRNDWKEALSRWEAVAQKFRHVAAEQGAARALQKLGRATEAASRLAEARRRFPLSEGLAITQAELAEQCGDKEESARLWLDAVRRFPRFPRSYRDAYRILRELGRPADAEAILIAAMDNFPADSWPAIEHASLASARQDWAEAAERWAVVRDRWPHLSHGYVRAAEALSAQGQAEAASDLRAEWSRRSSDVRPARPLSA